MFNRLSLSVAAVALIVAGLTWVHHPASVQAQAPKALSRWEFKVVDGWELTKEGLDRKSWEGTLKAIGDDGWELVSVVNTGDQCWYYFKRPK